MGSSNSQWEYVAEQNHPPLGRGAKDSLREAVSLLLPHRDPKTSHWTRLIFKKFSLFLVCV